MLCALTPSYCRKLCCMCASVYMSVCVSGGVLQLDACEYFWLLRFYITCAHPHKTCLCVGCAGWRRATAQRTAAQPTCALTSNTNTTRCGTTSSHQVRLSGEAQGDLSAVFTQESRKSVMFLRCVSVTSPVHFALSQVECEGHALKATDC